MLHDVPSPARADSVQRQAMQALHCCWQRVGQSQLMLRALSLASESRSYLHHPPTQVSGALLTRFWEIDGNLEMLLQMGARHLDFFYSTLLQAATPCDCRAA